jgi:hypothetical protein
MNQSTNDQLEIRPPGWVGIISTFLSLLLLMFSCINSVMHPPQVVGQITAFPTAVLNTTPTIVTLPTDVSFNAPTLEPSSPVAIQPGLSLLTNDTDPSLWFPQSLSHISERLITGGIDEVSREELQYTEEESQLFFEEWGRKNTYQRWYDDPAGCEADVLKGVYIQITFFESGDGAANFFTYAHSDASVEFIDSVGDNAYRYQDTKPEVDCEVEIRSITFIRYNVFVRVRVRFIEGKMDTNWADSILDQVTQFIDAQLLAAEH